MSYYVSSKLVPIHPLSWRVLPVLPSIVSIEQYLVLRKGYGCWACFKYYSIIMTTEYFRELQYVDNFEFMYFNVFYVFYVHMNHNALYTSILFQLNFCLCSVNVLQAFSWKAKHIYVNFVNFNLFGVRWLERF